MRLLRAALYEFAFLGLFLVALPALARRADPHLNALPIDPLRPAGILLLIAGLLLAESCVALLLRQGRGSQAPFDATRRLVTRGPYRFTRNPMALGFLAMLLGLSLALASPAVGVYALVVAAAVHALIVRREEPALRARFGAAWDAYAREVPRWVPRLRLPSFIAHRRLTR
jgi:protein-S-isoprenylcysteine O-methyltransferase Ste14